MTFTNPHNKPFIGAISALIFTFLLFSQGVLAQERCGTVSYNKQLKSEKNILETEQQFEEWLRNKIENRKSTLGTARTKAGPYQVPVVFHIIHKGEPLGTGVNITDAQIASQLSVLNKDFQRLNTDASSTPAEFATIVGSMDIQFVMAKINPEGAATAGIVRIKGALNQWAINDNYQLKAQSYWPAEDYLNIWVTDISGGYLGYAQLPISGLPGLENSPNNRMTDGVAIDYRAFGSIDDGAFSLESQYNKGRTATHEVSHFFGLRHIWGDDENEVDKCTGTDYVDDTPNQSISTSGCPAHPRVTCTTNDMFQNFQDYTNDVCMNLFTEGQVTRMMMVLENSPRRASLLTSPALQDPVPIAIDAGIKTIVSPQLIACDNPIVPSVTIKNYGTNPISSVQIRLLINGSPIETLTFTTNLSPDAEANFLFSPVTRSSGSYTFSFQILMTNGAADGNSDNNTVSVATLVPGVVPTPFMEDFNTTPSTWSISNPDQRTTWSNKTAPRDVPSNKAMYMDFYNYEDAEGENDILLTPVFDLSTTLGAYFTFDVAYAQFPGNSDGLRVYILTDCNGDLFAGEKVYDKFGSVLSTTASSSAAFTPSNFTQWRRETVSLGNFVGKNSVQIAFVGVNDWGNNLYLDHVSIVTDVDEDLTLKAILSPNILSCENVTTPSILVHNSGSVPILFYNVTYSLNSETPQVVPIVTNLLPGQNEIVILPQQTLMEGATNFSFELTEPNGLVDAIPLDNKKNINVVFNPARAVIPLRENFDTTFDNWSIVNPVGVNVWKSMATNYNQSLRFDTFDNPTLGDKTWLISPSLDFSKTTTASMFFDLSHAFKDDDDSLIVLSTKNCGMSFELLDILTGNTLNTAVSPTFWTPSTPDDWRRAYENLNALAGEPDVRLAFVAINDQGNNVYLDNIEFFISDTPDPYAAQPPFQVYGTDPTSPDEFYITFNLPEQSTVGYEVVDMMGRTLVSEQVGYVLNQTFSVDAGNVSPGIYILRIRIGTNIYASKIYLSTK